MNNFWFAPEQTWPCTATRASGRTGVMTCCIRRDFSEKTTGEAIDYVRQFMQTNMTDEQMRLVDRFAP